MKDDPSQTRRQRIWPITVASLIATAILLALGTWQLDRRAWKHDLIQRLEASIEAAPVPLDEVQGQPGEFLHVTAKGRFLPVERHLFATYNGAPGWRVISPFELANGMIVLVDRGFAPQDMKDTTAGLKTGQEVTISGVVRYHGDDRTMFTPDNRPGEDVWYWWDFPALADSLALPPDRRQRIGTYALQLENGGEASGWPRPTRAVPELSDRHLGYAITWYGLAASLVVIYLIYIRRVVQSRKSG